MMRVGLPRALIFYQYFPMWKTFFEHLGAEVVVSGETNASILAAGAARVVADTCLPTKVFCGHVLSIVDRIDCVFAPSVRSLEPQVYNCSKFLGLPDLIRNVIPECPEVLDIEIDVNKGEKALRQQVLALGRRFTHDVRRIEAAMSAGADADQRYQRALQQGMMPPQALVALGFLPPTRESARNRTETTTEATSGLRVAVIGHPYNVYDSYINHGLLSRLQRMGVEVMTAEVAPAGALDQGTRSLVGKTYWTYEDEVVGAAGHYLEADVDGIVCIVSFGCGPDSLMVDVIQRAAKRKRTKPLVLITIDEHTGEAGLVTRLEAFVDMLERRRRAVVRLAAG